MDKPVNTVRPFRHRLLQLRRRGQAAVEWWHHLEAPRFLKGAVLATAVAYLINFFFLAFLIGPFDYDHLSGYWEIAWRFWRSQPHLPAYNPYLCGGRTLGADPQIPIFHPFVPLVPLLGATVLIKWEMLGQLALGVWGLWGMLDYLKVSPPGKLWGVFLFACGGAVVARFLVGHVTLGFLFLYPLFFFLSYRASESPRLFFPLAYFGLFIYSALYKPNFLIYGVPVLLLEAVARSVATKSVRPLGLFLVGVAFGGMANATSLLPASRYFSQFPRVDGSQPLRIAFAAFLANVLLPLKAIPKAFYGPGFLQRHEYNFFLGPVALIFVAPGIMALKRVRPAEFAALAVFAAASAWIGFGAPRETVSPLWPYSWFRLFWPGFASIRVPTRFWFGTYLGLVVFSAAGFRTPSRRMGRVALVILGVLPVLLSGLINLTKTSSLATQTQWVAPRLYPYEVRQFRQAPGKDEAYRLLRQGKSVIDCVDNIQVYRSPELKEGDMLSLDGPFGLWGDAQWIDWDHIRIQAQAPTPFSVHLNLNHHPYWEFRGRGAEIVSGWGEPLTLRTRPTENHLEGELVFRQPLVGEAVVMSALGWLSFLGLIGWACYKRRA